MSVTTRRLGYLSGAPRVSTNPEAELAGPRSHVLGTITAFEHLGWRVSSYIAGDHLPTQMHREGSESSMSRSYLRRLGADFLRVLLGVIASRKSHRWIGDVDVIYERLAAMMALGQRYKRKGVPWIVESNAILAIEAGATRRASVATPLLRYFERRAYRQCDLIVAVTAELKLKIAELYGVPLAKIRVVPNGVDLQRFDPAATVPKRLHDAFTIGFVGSLAPWQGLSHLLDAVAEIRSDCPMAVTIVGSGPLKHDLESQAAALDLPVAFVGRVHPDDVPAYILGFDVGYSGQTPHHENTMWASPLKLYEYLAMGVPPVASSYEDVRKILGTSQEAGFPYTPGSVSSLADALRAAYRRHAELSSMGQSGRQRVLDNVGWPSRYAALSDELARSLEGQLP